MSQTLLSAILSSTVLSALITGIFALAGKLLDAKFKTVSVSTTTSASVTQTVNGARHQPSAAYPPHQSRTSVTQIVTSASQSISPSSFGRVLIHIGVVQFVVNIVAAVIGFTLGVTGQLDALIPLILLFGTLALIAGFAWVGTRVNKATRWKHLLYVAIGVVIVTVLTNALILQTPITLLTLIGASLQTFLAMGIGGAIASAFKK